MKRFNRDLFGMASPTQVGNATMSIIDGLHRFPAHVQVAAVCAAFLLLTEEARIPVSDAFTTVKNIMNDANGKRPEFDAVAAYIKHEL